MSEPPEADLAIRSVNQEELEKSIIDKASSELTQRENELDERRLEKTLKKRQTLESHISVLSRRIADPRTLISQREKAKNELDQIKSTELRQLQVDEQDIRDRIGSRRSQRSKTRQEPDESEHDFLVRTGKITPFTKPGAEVYPSEVNPDDTADDDHKVLMRPVEQFEGDEDETEARLYRDDGILTDYQSRFASWKRVRDTNINSIPKDAVIDKTTGFKVPGDIWRSLFGYQRTGVSWLWELYAQKVGGIIGDEMGLGKTVQVAAFLAGLQYSGMLKKPVLIVCPATVMNQWVKELHQWWPPLRVAILHTIGTAMGGKRKAEADFFDDIYDEEDDFEDTQPTTSAGQSMARDLVNSIFETGHVLVTTYAGLKSYEQLISRRSWGYCCLDEGHKIRNPDAEISLIAKQIKTPHRLILSGTPIQNNLTELWSLFDFIFPGRLGTLPVFKAQFSLPINVGGYANATNIQVQTAYKCAVLLRDMIAPYMLRRMKSDVASDLPPKTEKVLFCKLTKPQKQAYLQFLKSEELGSILKGRRQVLYGVDILRKICNHPDLILQDTRDPDYGNPSRSGKMQVVKALIMLWKSQGHRALLFSQTKQMLDILERSVADWGLKYLRMDGGTAISQRQALVDEFNNDTSYQIFLLTTKVGGLGVNLTGADRVIIYDPDWNPSTDVQARERAWRLGQKNEVMIYRLMIAGSIEEKIYQRQIFKQFLSNKILKDPKQKRFFKTSDLHDLFSLGDSSESAEMFDTATSQSEEADLPRPRSTEKKSDDLEQLAGVSKESDFISSGDNDKRDEEGSLLEGLFAKAGVQSTLEHDAVINASRPDTVLMEREAERVANQAASALRESRKVTQKAKIGTPTWTGRSGLAGKIKKGPREVKGGASSSRILEGLRQKKDLETRTKSSQQLNESDLGSYAGLMDRIQDYIASQPNQEATSADIVGSCNVSLTNPQSVANLRQILRKIATWDGKRWKLNDPLP